MASKCTNSAASRASVCYPAKSGASGFLRSGLKRACIPQRTPFPLVTLFNLVDCESSQLDCDHMFGRGEMFKAAAPLNSC